MRNIAKLGIVVVYLVREEDGKLLDLHLDQIEKNTEIPYTVYGSTHGLLPKFQKKLEQNPKVKVCTTPTTDAWGHPAHAFYLEHLIKNSVEDGASHIVLLHVDSFPVRPGWAKTVAEKLSDTCVLVAVEREGDQKPFDGFMFFHRDFYLKYQPTIQVSTEERATQEFKEYFEKFKQINDGGIGYGFKIYKEGLNWHHLYRSNKGEGHYFFNSIYGDFLYHLGAATADKKSYPGRKEKHQGARLRPSPSSPRASKIRKLLLAPINFVLKKESILKTAKRLTKFLPKRTKAKLKSRVDIRSPQNIRKEAHEQEKAFLYKDPESHFKFLLTGNR